MISLHFTSILLLLSISSVTCAADLQLGQKLTAKERQALLSSATLQLGQERFQIMPSHAAPKHAAKPTQTWVVNSQGVVGLSLHLVVVGQANTSVVRAALNAGNLPKPVEVRYNDTTHISHLRYASFADAVRARNVLAPRLPGASVTVPVQYSRPRKR